MDFLFPDDEEEIENHFGNLLPGRVFVYPTDTFYSIGCDSYDSKAVQKIYRLKSRDGNKALLVLVSNWGMFGRAVHPISKKLFQFLSQFWPNLPLTGVFKSRHPIQTFLNPENDSIAIRYVSQPCAAKIIESIGNPIVGTSANLSEMPPSKSMAQAKNYFSDWVNDYVDGGSSERSRASTIVDLRGRTPKIIRHGAISERDILSVWKNS